MIARANFDNALPKPPIDPVTNEPQHEDFDIVLARYSTEFHTRADRVQEGGEFIAGFMHGLAFSVILYAIGGFLIYLGIRIGV
jgi:tetrahydromethanopterin S-methyltransferase subunit F